MMKQKYGENLFHSHGREKPDIFLI